jgi:hypothetical protein
LLLLLLLLLYRRRRRLLWVQLPVLLQKRILCPCNGVVGGV